MSQRHQPRPAKPTSEWLAAILISLSLVGPAFAEAAPTEKTGSSVSDSPSDQDQGADHLPTVLPFLVKSSEQKRLAAELRSLMEQGNLRGAENSLNKAIETGTLAIALIDYLRDPNLLTALQGLDIQDAEHSQSADANTAAEICSTPSVASADAVTMQEALDQEQSYSSMLSRTLTDLTKEYNSLTTGVETSSSGPAATRQTAQQEQQCAVSPGEFAQLQSDYRTLQNARDVDTESNRSSIAALKASLQQEKERGVTVERQLAGARDEVRSLQGLKDKETAAEARVADVEKALAQAQARGDELSRMLADATEALHVVQNAQEQRPAVSLSETAPPDHQAGIDQLPKSGSAAVEIAQVPESPGPLPSGAVSSDAAATPAPLPAPAVKAGPLLPDLKPNDRLTSRADELLHKGDVSGARLLLERSLEGGNARAAFLLAETYDPQVLSQLGVRGIRGDVEKARELYVKAKALGIDQASERMQALK